MGDDQAHIESYSVTYEQNGTKRLSMNVTLGATEHAVSRELECIMTQQTAQSDGFFGDLFKSDKEKKQRQAVQAVIEKVGPLLTSERIQRLLVWRQHLDFATDEHRLYLDDERYGTLPNDVQTLSDLEALLCVIKLLPEIQIALTGEGKIDPPAPPDLGKAIQQTVTEWARQPMRFERIVVSPRTYTWMKENMT